MAIRDSYATFREYHNRYMRRARACGKWLHDSQEYKTVRVGHRIVREHRLVMEKYLGRQLMNHLGVMVHHIDGSKRGNEFENLAPITYRDHYHEHRCFP